MSKENTSNSNNGASVAELSKLQAVKELIFGQEIQDYSKQFKEIEDKFEALHSLLDDTKQLLNEKIDLLDKELNGKLVKVEEQLIAKIEKLQASKTDRDKLGKLLISVGEKLQA